MAFEKRKLGKTSVEVSVLGLGCATLAGIRSPVIDSVARTIVLDAIDSGITYVDTAPFYGYGKSEHMVGDELRDRDGWVLSTKVGRLLKPRRQPQTADDPWKAAHPFEPVFDFSYDAIMRSYEDSMQRLGLNRIDILYMHDVDVYLAEGDKSEAEYRAAVDSTYKALDELRRAGDIGAIGLGVNEVKPMIDALNHGQWDAFLLAGRYTLLEQGPLDDVLPAVEAHGASIVIGGPFNSGILVGGDTWNYEAAPAEIVDRASKLRRICESHNVPLPAAALQFPLAHSAVAATIPGPRTAAELNQIMEWMRQPIPASLWSDLKSEQAIHADSPVPAT